MGIPTARPLTKTCLRNRSGFASVSDDLVPSLREKKVGSNDEDPFNHGRASDANFSKPERSA